MAGQLKASPLCQSASPAVPEGQPLIALEIPTGGGERSHGHPRGDKEASSVIPGSGRVLPEGRVPLVTARPVPGNGDGSADRRIWLCRLGIMSEL